MTNEAICVLALVGWIILESWFSHREKMKALGVFKDESSPTGKGYPMTAKEHVAEILNLVSDCKAEYMTFEDQQMRVYRSPDGKPRAVLCGRLEQLMNQIDKEATRE